MSVRARIKAIEMLIRRFIWFTWIAVLCSGICAANEDLEFPSVKSLNTLAEENDKNIDDEERVNQMEGILQNNGIDKSNDEDKMRSIYDKVLLNLKTDSGKEQTNKRACKLNLGGHCATDNAVAMADQWTFLKSHHSPGKRNRRAAAAAPTLLDSRPESDVQTAFHLWKKRRNF